MKRILAPFAAYFSRPFPKAVGFSAYRMPGLMVHAPVIMMSMIVGAWLCGKSALWPALWMIYILVGLYAGRDLAILAHYNPLILLAVWAGLVTALIQPQWASDLAQGITRASPWFAVTVAAVVLVTFLTHVAFWRRRA